MGKITLIKSLLVSQLIYILTPLPTYTNALQTVNKLLFEFLWHGKGDKIKREHIIRDYEQGGLRMIDIHTFNKSLNHPESRSTALTDLHLTGSPL